MKIHDLKTSSDKGQVKVSVSVSSKELGQKELWFSVPDKYADFICTDRLDAFAIGMIFPAAQYNENLILEGRISEKLLFNLNNYIVPLINTFSPSTGKIIITSEETTSERYDTNGIGTGFSGGVDSFCTLYDRYELEKDPAFKINTLLFLNTGQHGPANTPSEENRSRVKFQNRYNHLKIFTDEAGLDLIPVDSNLSSFHPWSHQKTATLTSISGVLTLQKLFRKYYLSSTGFTYKDYTKYSWRFADRDICDFCDPMALPLLSTESLDLLLDGIQYSRTEKTVRILDYEPASRYLNVCIGAESTYRNCSVCSKCCRTLMTIKAIGKLEKVAGIFDIKKYTKKAEFKFVVNQIMKQNENPFAYQNVRLARKNRVKMPSLFTCFVVYYFDRLKRIAYEKREK